MFLMLSPTCSLLDPRGESEARLPHRPSPSSKNIGFGRTQRPCSPALLPVQYHFFQRLAVTGCADDGVFAALVVTIATGLD